MLFSSICSYYKFELAHFTLHELTGLMKMEESHQGQEKQFLHDYNGHWSTNYLFSRVATSRGGGLPIQWTGHLQRRWSPYLVEWPPLEEVVTLFSRLTTSRGGGYPIQQTGHLQRRWSPYLVKALEVVTLLNRSGMAKVRDSRGVQGVFRVSPLGHP